MTPAAKRVLDELARVGVSLTPGELEQRTGIGGEALGLALGELEALGYARSTGWRVTAEGLAATEARYRKVRRAA